jgi:hypothetical protein
LIAISKQQHGQEHKITKDLERGLLQCKTSYVRLSNRGLFEVLRYEGDKYVVRGPYNVAEAGRQTLRVDEADARMQLYGTPVVIHGFGNRAAYLNGKIGDISFDPAADRYGVYFEDKSIKPKGVKPENVRILFELPDI